MNNDQKLRALPAQFIETKDGLILKRGCAEVRIRGHAAWQVLEKVFATASRTGVTRDEICAPFAGPHRKTVERLVQRLIDKRLLVPADFTDQSINAPEANLDIFYWNFGHRAQVVTERLNSLHFAVLGVNYVSRQLISSLRGSGVDNFQLVDILSMRNLRLFGEAGELRKDQWPDELTRPQDFDQWADETDPLSLDCVVATSDFGGRQVHREWNKFCVRHKRHYLPVVLQDGIGQLGPLVVPGETACFECLYLRQNSHLKDPQVQRASDEVAFEGQAFTGFHPSMASVLGDLAAIELTKFYSGAFRTINVGTFIEVNLLVPELISHKVLKVPRCPVCSPMNTRPSTTPRNNVFNALDEGRT